MEGKYISKFLYYKLVFLIFCIIRNVFMKLIFNENKDIVLIRFYLINFIICNLYCGFGLFFWGEWI